MTEIRQADLGDLDIVYEIAARTGDAGKDARPQHDFPELVGQIYAAPYLHFAPELAFVAEAEGRVLGYCVGTTDTLAFGAQLDADWWPDLRRKYPRDLKCKPADAERIAAIHDPEVTPEEVVTRFPAHLHMNLLPDLRGQGVGGRLMARWAERARALGVTAAHIGADPRNAGGIGFWAKQGFERLDTPLGRGTVWMGQRLD